LKNKRTGFTWSIAIALIASLLVGEARAASKDRDKATPQEVFDAMRDAFQCEKARGVYARYLFQIGGAQGGEWWIEVSNGKFKMGRGSIAMPNVTLVASDKDWVALGNDRLSGVWATLTGRLKVRGDQTLARKLDEMFP
jgi:putative sterol carrier protein